MKLLFILVIALSFINEGYSEIYRNIIDFSAYNESNTSLYEFKKNPKNPYGHEDWKIEIEYYSEKTLYQNTASFAYPVTSKKFNKVLAVKAIFEQENRQGIAHVKHSTNIQIYGNSGKFKNIGKGILPNVWKIKAVGAWINGRLLDYQCGILFSNHENEFIKYNMGSINFEGWRKIVWRTPNDENKWLYNGLLKESDIASNTIPFLKFESIYFSRNNTVNFNEFYTFIGPIEIAYLPYINDVEDKIADDRTMKFITEEDYEEMYLKESKY